MSNIAGAGKSNRLSDLQNTGTDFKRSHVDSIIKLYDDEVKDDKEADAANEPTDNRREAQEWLKI